MNKIFRSLLCFLLAYSQTGLGAGPLIWNGTRSKALTSKGIYLSDTSVVDNDGVLNYVKNGHGEVDATGWATYADAAGTVPIDCTGGSPSETLTQTSTTPPVGSGSLILTKGATNRQGEGAAYAFSIDNAYKSQPLYINILAQGSASYAANDVGIYIYDVTNSTLIYPSSVNIAASGIYTYQASFTATTSTSYRLCVHTSSVNASAYTVYLDSISVGPQKVLIGAAMTAAKTDLTFLPQNFGTVTSPFYTYQRVANVLKVNIRFLTGTTAAATASIQLPAGLTIDTTLLSTAANAQSVGSWQRMGAASQYLPSANNSGVMFHDGSSTNNIFVGSQGSSQTFLKLNASGVWASGDAASLQFEVPIAEWAGSGGNVTMADRSVEDYAYNTNLSSDADDIISMANGPIGIGFPTVSFTAPRKRRVRFSSPIQVTDRLVLEVQSSGVGVWIELTNDTLRYASNYHSPFVQQASIYSGVGILPGNVNSTDVDVLFGQYSVPGNTYGSAGSNWGSATTSRWRVRKVAGGAAVGYPIAPANISNTLTDSANYSGNTRMGLKQYLHGTTYNGGIAPTVTNPSGLAGFAIARAVFVPYQMDDGTWRCKFNIGATFTNVSIGGTTVNLQVLGLAGRTVTNGQAITGWFKNANAVPYYAQLNSGSNTMELYAIGGGIEGGVRVSGDVELDSKPTWAY